MKCDIMIEKPLNSLKLSDEHVFDITKFNNNYRSKYFYNIKHTNESKGLFSIQNRRYLGSKYKLLEFISWVVEKNCKNINCVADIFAGTGIVANMFNSSNMSVIVNDLLHSNYLIYNTFFSNCPVNLDVLREQIIYFNCLDVKEDNYFSENFGNSFFTLENSRKIGFIREYIEENNDKFNFREQSILITSLIYAADKVANTCGHYDAFRRNLDSKQKLNLSCPYLSSKIDNSDNLIFKKDANELVKEISPDLVYIDPPYNSRQYGDTYHLLENLAEWKKPDVFGVAKKMKNRQKTKSKYCTVKAPKAFEKLIIDINAKYILVSYNNMAQKGSGRSNAKISNNEIFEILNMRGNVKVFSSDYNTFTTGKTSISNHQELLYFCEIDN